MLKPLKKLKRVPKKDLSKALSDAFSRKVKAVDEKLNKELLELNRSQERANTRLAKENDYLKAATEKLESLLKDRDLTASEGQKELNDLKATLSSTTIDLLRQIESERVIREEIQNDDNDVLNSLWAQMELLKEELDRVNKAAIANTQRFLTGPVGGGRGGAVRIENEGELITETASCLNFIGEDVLVVPDPDNPDCLAIYIPPPPFALQFINCNPGLIEIGIVVDTVNLTWDWTVPDVINQLLTGPGTYSPVTDASRSASPTDLMNDRTNQTWCISAEDPLTGLTDSGCCPLIFGAFQYWGRLPSVPTNSAEVRSLSSSRLVSGKDSTIDFGTNATPQFTLFCYPDAYGDLGDVINPANNFAIPTIREANVNVTNDQGITLVYRVYRANQLQAGQISWEFSSNSGIQLTPV